MIRKITKLNDKVEAVDLPPLPEQLNYKFYSSVKFPEPQMQMKITPQPPFSRALDVQPRFALMFIINPDRKRKRWMMKVFSHIKWMLLILIIVLAGCRETVVEPTEIALVETATETAVPTETVMVTEPVDESVISPENVYRLQIVDYVDMGKINDVDLSPDAKTFAVTSAADVTIYDFETLEEVWSFPEDDDISFTVYKAFSYSPDNRFYALSTDNKILIIDVQKQSVVFEFDSQFSDYLITEVTFSPTGDQLIVTSQEWGSYSCDGPASYITIYDLIRRGPIIYTNHVCTQGSPRFYTFVDNNTLALGNIYEKDFHGVIFVDVVTGQEISRYSFPNEVIVDSLNPDGTQAAVYSYADGQTKIVDLESGETDKFIDRYITFLNSSYRVQQDAELNYSLVNQEYEIQCSFPSEFDFLNVNYWGQPQIFRDDMLYIQHRYPDDNLIEFWDLSSCELIKEMLYESLVEESEFPYKPHNDRYWEEYTGDGVFEIRDSTDYSLVIELKPIPEIESQPKETNYYNFVSDFSPDGALFIAQGDHQKEGIYVWNVQTGEVLAIFNIPLRLENMAFTDDGKFIAMQSNGVTYFWGVPTE
jgi:WD40 repeat protein